ncbi:acyltransferase family protein [Leptospirillum ferrooxidans]|uniref:Acyltransferase 3 domain-containing protein n=1 Tax=Leptospirillum ferrooxidans (strain C2-3) TaxID=1162668 RepID=I0IP22_LEPFC|nr:acyltransferase family protein [Leptospirillum ferrooxidans]BAM07021.1 hypothetical protein LFE_1338 [Leptospirillum ferrooxidans C2-3]
MQMGIQQGGKRKESLEALRGLASIIVVLWHSILGFHPEWVGIFQNSSINFRLPCKYYFVLMNGTGAVILFFVLSGFVLSRTALVNENKKNILINSIKRLPRLAVLTTIATLISWTFFYLNFYHFKEAGKITNSPWLSSFANSYTSGNPFLFSFWDALNQGLWKTFIIGDYY